MTPVIKWQIYYVFIIVNDINTTRSKLLGCYIDSWISNKHEQA